MIKKFGAAAVALTTLALAACGTANEPVPTQTSEPVAVSSETPAPALPEPVVGEVGEPVSIYGIHGESAELTLTNMSLGQDCFYGTNDYGGENEPDFGKLEEGERYLQVWAEVESGSEGTFIVDDPRVIDDEGFTMSIAPDVDCRDGDDTELWHSPVNAGEKKRTYGAFVIPAGTEVATVTINDVEFDADESVTGEIEEVESEPAVEEPVVVEPMTTARDAVGDPYSPENLYSDKAAQGFPAPTADDPSGYAEWWYSSPYNPALAEAIAEQERLAEIPIAEGGTCPAYKCGYGTDPETGERNPSSGELQMKALCESGSEYVTAEQCEAVAWVEHPNY